MPLTVLTAAILLSSTFATATVDGLPPVTTQQPQPISSNTNLVVVRVVAVDSKGKTVADLTQSHFENF